MASQLSPRQLIVLSGTMGWQFAQCNMLISEFAAKHIAFFSDQMLTDCSQLMVAADYFSLTKSANALGREWDLIIFDANTGLHLEALAIASGTLRAGGLLLFLVQSWQDFTKQPDSDSLRWSGSMQPIVTPNFRHYFQQCLLESGFSCYQQHHHSILDCQLKLSSYSPSVFKLTPAQEDIANHLFTKPAHLNLLTAKRGRGKSSLAGYVIQQLSQQAHVWVTAPNRSSLFNLQYHAQNKLHFIAPDALFAQGDREEFCHSWLIVDEAASIPLPLLQQFSQRFAHLLLLSTTQSYEGTGQGLLLKLVKYSENQGHSVQHFRLEQPLRWASNDPLELLIERLLFLSAHDEQIVSLSSITDLTLQWVIREELSTRELGEFYRLLHSAHYRTTPMDLRRLFDAPKQYLYAVQVQQKWLACLWAIAEGSIQDENLITQIWSGERRPKGNLAAQTLCFQASLPQACRLSSLRVSRFALLPALQNQGLGQRWFRQWLIQLKDSLAWDFVSVSFGYQEDLAHFWQKCGFQIVHIGQHQEASSGCYSAIALYPITSAGEEFCQQAVASFQRHIGLSFHPLAEKFTQYIDWSLNTQDFSALQGFAFAQRSLASTIPALRRYLLNPKINCPKLRAFLQHAQPLFEGGKKSWLVACRLELQQALSRDQNLDKTS